MKIRPTLYHIDIDGNAIDIDMATPYFLPKVNSLHTGWPKKSNPLSRVIIKEY